MTKTRDCLKCGAGFYDDGNTWCPRCDADVIASMPGVLRDASARVLAMRTHGQENLKAGRELNDPPWKA